MENISNTPNAMTEEQANMYTEIQNQNTNFCNGLRNRVEAECAALARSGDSNAMFIGDIINAVVNNIVNIFEDLSKTNDNLINIPFFSEQVMQSVNAIMAGGIISPLTGCDEEWVDVTVPEDVGQHFRCEYREKEYEIEIESVQVNARYSKIYRLNNDNRFAHRIDYIQFHDATNTNKVHLTADSIRFIQFPYTMESVHTACVINSENQISDYLNCDHETISNGLVYGNYNSDNPTKYLIAPKIPFHMLEDEGISIDTEIEDYFRQVAENLSADDYEDDDSDFYDGHSQPDEDM